MALGGARAGGSCSVAAEGEAERQSLAPRLEVTQCGAAVVVVAAAAVVGPRLRLRLRLRLRRPRRRAGRWSGAIGVV